MKQEIWKTIPSNPKYEVSNFGRIRFVRIIKPRKSNTGYFRVALAKPQINCQSDNFSVHRLVAEAFIGECHKGMHVNHIDGNKENNDSDNLEYLTPKENMQHAIKMGLIKTLGDNAPRKKYPERYPVGESVNTAKLTSVDITNIRNKYNNGISIKELMTEYSMSKAQISKIAARKSWIHIH